MFRLTFTSVLLIACPLAAAQRPDILVADFEADSYGTGWKTTGDAFGTGPAKGTLPDQMHVDGFLGKGLVNSFKGGDTTTGTLTSPEFTIERKYLNFLLGGGKHKGTRIDLIVEGKAARTATGPNDRSGGSERLVWYTWDVSDLAGKAARIQIVDQEKGGWGHINVDHIVQSDARKQAERAVRKFAIDKRYLLLPVKNRAPMSRVAFWVGNEVVREFDIELAEDEPDFWVFADVSAFQGKMLAAQATLPAGSKALDALKLSDELPDAEKAYQEKHRPLFHFTSRVGWLNDPNGLVYVPDSKAGITDTGTWHLFYQHNPFGREWGNMHWGHATSKDLFRWKEQGVALYPRRYGDWAFSGSAVVDHGNTSGWGTKEKPPLVLAYTSTGRGECIAYSTDHGKSWKEFSGNPVVKHGGRDPKLIWYAKGKHWVMAVYDEHDKKQWIAFYTSPDLKKWTFASRIEHFFECPDLFELPLPNVQLKGGPPETKWVLYAADGKYVLGDFDGKTFQPDAKEKKQLWHGNFYAAQSFDNPPLSKAIFGVKTGTPRLRRVQIGWARGVSFPGTPFNQQMVVPVELSLMDGGKSGPVLVANPVVELASLREGNAIRAVKRPGSIVGAREGGKESRLKLADDLDTFEIVAELNPGKAATIGFDLRGIRLEYNVAKQILTCRDVSAPVKLRDGKLALHILVDRGSVEVFANQGRTALSVAALPDGKNLRAELFATGGGEYGITEITIYRLKSSWDK